MKRPTTSLSLPGSAEELLDSLRAARLISRRRAAAISQKWQAQREPYACETRLRELVTGEVLTHYQAGQVLAGRGHRLRLGPYRILDRLGIGGMGQVYKAEHILMRRVVALKVVARLPRTSEGNGSPLRAGEPSRRELVARFRREVRSAGRMSHPNIVAAHDAGVARGFLYLVMEFVDGVDLGRYVAEHGPLPIPLACEAVRQAALGLQYAYDRGLVHRDIKPENLLLTWPGASAPLAPGSMPSLPDGSSGDGGTLVKLVDLGLALPSSLPPEQAQPAGTPDYIAPEQARGEGPVDIRSDLYSLGCTFYYLLTGRVPYPGGSWTEKLLRHGLERPCAVNVLRPEVTPAVAAVVERLMAKNPEERYPRPAAVAAVLWGLAEQGWYPAIAPVRPSEAMASEGPGEFPSVPSLPDVGPVPPQIPARPEPPRRRRVPATRAILAAALTGLLVVVVSRSVWPREQVLQPQVPPPAQQRTLFRVDRTGSEFATLKEAIAAAESGDTVMIACTVPVRLEPADMGSKALTLLGVGKERPHLECSNPSSVTPWQALFATAAPLAIENLDLSSAAEAPLVASSGPMLRLTNCVLATSAGVPAVVGRGARVEINLCHIRAARMAVAVEAGDGPSHVEMCANVIAITDRAGAAAALWAAEDCKQVNAELRFERNVVAAGRALSFHSFPGRLCIDVKSNDLTCREALLDFSGYANRADWHRRTSWSVQDNRCRGPAPWIRVDGHPLNTTTAAANGLTLTSESAAGPGDSSPAAPAGLR